MSKVVWRESFGKVLRLKSWKLYALAHSLDARSNAVQHTTIDYRGVFLFPFSWVRSVPFFSVRIATESFIFVSFFFSFFLSVLWQNR